MNNILYICDEASSEVTDSDSNIEDTSHGNNMVHSISNCNDSACFHAVTAKSQLSSDKVLGMAQLSVTDATSIMQQRYDSETFRGILVDSRCSHILTSGVAQYLTYYRTFCLTPNVNTTKQTPIVFPNRRHSSPVTAIVRFPIAHRWLECKTHLLPMYLPLLLSLKDMYNLGIYFDNLANIVVHKSSNTSTPVLRKWEHVFITWSSTQVSYFTELELRNLHRIFGHPHVRKLANVIRRVTGNRTPHNTFRILQ